MTREKAIEILRGGELNPCVAEDREACEMAIKALEEQPCDDVIDRAEAMTGIMMFTGNVKSDEEDIYIKVSDAVNLLRELPSVTPQPKMGHWEQYGDFWEDKYRCSECGEKQPKILCGERIVGYWSDFCPNCGARMVEPQESEETDAGRERIYQGCSCREKRGV